MNPSSKHDSALAPLSCTPTFAPLARGSRGRALIVATALVGLAGGCGDDRPDLPMGGTGVNPGIPDPGTTSDGGPDELSSITETAGGPAPASGGPDPDGMNPNCGGDTQVAEQKPLDLYIMLDSSGSMLEETGRDGVDRWTAISQSIGSFIEDPTSAGMGIGLQYFPLRTPGVPAECSDDAACGEAGPCLLRACLGEAQLTACSDDDDCWSGSCVDLGRCENSGALCGPVGTYCDRGRTEVCEPITSSFCMNEISCDPAVYADPAVAIEVLPDSAPALLASIASTEPEGNTPTAAALAGALDQAKTWAESHPERAVVVVLATDGLPTACDPQDADGIAAIAAGARESSPAVSTFVIGIIDDETGGPLLDQVAAAGGSDSAYLLDPMSPALGDDFRAALDAIRQSVLACEYQIPEPTGTSGIDYEKVNVEHTVGDQQPTTIPYVGSAAGCEGAESGWHYDVDPAEGEPTRIIVCDQTCDEFASGGQVDIRIGCATVVYIP